MSGGLDQWTPEQAKKAKLECKLSDEEEREFKSLLEKNDLSEEENKKILVFQGRLKKLEVIQLWFPDE